MDTWGGLYFTNYIWASPTIRHATTLTATVAFTFVSVFLVAVADSANNESQVRCSKTCIVENCNTIGIKYGKYCGVGWSGCPGEKPCDDLDACCKIHDECVEKKGLTNIKCHEKFKNCIRKVKKTGKVGFSEICPYEIAMPTMIQGMDMAIMFSQFGLPKDEL
ncbi:probable phospholipase A2 homolog 1 [Euphorbia lathyris]|uniref:probable phospholipase A2 homolog 1 n=1 Tax=Euphorbia lathyris TaxID=212925 RepID=UPI003313A04F